MFTKSRLIQSCLIILGLSAFLGACQPIEKHIHHRESSPIGSDTGTGTPAEGSGQLQADGASSGGGSFADESSKWILQYAQKELVQDLRNLNPKILSNLPKDWTPAKLADVIENIRLQPNVQRARYGRELTFDYGVDADGTPYIEVLKLFFDARSSIPINSLTVVEKRPYVDEVKLLIMHEAAHLLGYGLNEDTDMSEARVVAHLILEAMKADKVACYLEDTKLLQNYLDLGSYPFEELPQKFGLIDPNSAQNSLTTLLLVHLPSLQGDFLIMGDDELSYYFFDTPGSASNYNVPRKLIDAPNMSSEALDEFQIPLRDRAMAVSRSETYFGNDMWDSSYVWFRFDEQSQNYEGPRTHALGYVHHFGGRDDKNSNIVLTFNKKTFWAVDEDGESEDWTSVGNGQSIPPCESDDCTIVVETEDQTLSIDKAKMTGTWSFEYKVADHATSQVNDKKSVHVPVSCKYVGYVLPANPHIWLKETMEKYGYNDVDLAEELRKAKVNRHDWRY